MPLVAAGGEPLEAPLSEAHGRARKIDPAFTEGELVRVAGGRNQTEAEFIQALLLEWGVPSILRRTRRLRRARLPRRRAARRARARSPAPRPRARCCSRRTSRRRPPSAAHGPRPLVLAAVIGFGGAAAALLAWLIRLQGCRAAVRQ